MAIIFPEKLTKIMLLLCHHIVRYIQQIWYDHPYDWERKIKKKDDYAFRKN